MSKRSTLELLAPGIAAFAVLLPASILTRLLSFWLLLSLCLYGWGVLPAGLLLSIAAISCLCWRRHPLSGLSVLGAVALVLALSLLPHPVTSPVGWSANALRILYYREDLKRSYLAAKARGDALPVGLADVDGFGSLTSGLAYDPSDEIALPDDKRSDSWARGPGATELGVRDIETHHIFGSYYHWFHP